MKRTLDDNPEMYKIKILMINATLNFIKEPCSCTWKRLSLL